MLLAKLPRDFLLTRAECRPRGAGSGRTTAILHFLCAIPACTLFSKKNNAKLAKKKNTEKFHMNIDVEFTVAISTMLCTLFSRNVNTFLCYDFKQLQINSVIERFFSSVYSLQFGSIFTHIRIKMDLMQKICAAFKTFTFI
jgi:uncharacterized membrane protein